MDTSLNLAEIARGQPLGSAWALSLVSWAAALVIVRSLPSLLFALRAPGIHRVVRGLAAGSILATGWVVVAFRTQFWSEVPFALGGMAYFAALTWLAWRALRAGDLASWSRSALFLACAIACVLLPCLVLPLRTANVIRLMGFEVMLALYSLLVSVRESEAPNLRESLFFVLANPVLVFGERGYFRGAERFDVRSLLRVLLGFGQILACVGVVEAYHHLGVADRMDGFAAVFVVFALALYFLHAGAASVQIGWVGMLGWRVRERYLRPYAATSPLDFWRRWNRYLGSWLRRYVFTSTRRQLGRSGVGQTARSTAQAIAIFATFLGAGLLHDAANYPANFDLSLKWTFAFVVAGLSVAVWAATVRLLDALRARWRGRGYRLARPLGIVCGTCANLGQLACMVWILGDEPGSPMNPAAAAVLGLRDLGF